MGVSELSGCTTCFHIMSQKLGMSKKRVLNIKHEILFISIILSATFFM